MTPSGKKSKLKYVSQVRQLSHVNQRFGQIKQSSNSLVSLVTLHRED